MSVLFILVPVSLLLAGGAVAVFVWSAARGQFEDLDTPPLRMLHDDEGLPQTRCIGGVDDVPSDSTQIKHSPE